MDYKNESLKMHKQWKGKIEVVSRAKIDNKQSLSLAYTPGVASACLQIKDDINKSYELTRRHNLVAVITDGSAVLGLGDIGAQAAMPVMEGKCVIFKEFADVDAFPLCINTKDIDELVRTIYLLSGSFGGINLEDISAPRCFEVERRLVQLCDIPVFHDDQHGTAIVVGAALKNALYLAGKNIQNVKIVINGAGSAGTAIATLLAEIGAKNIIMSDIIGVLCRDNENLPPHHLALARQTNPNLVKGKLSDAMAGADVFIGVSAKDCVSADMVKSMAKNAILFPMANPDPEISYDAATNAGAFIVGTGRSDYPNQINNALAFPGIFKGALKVRASQINQQMKAAAVDAIAGSIAKSELNRNCIVPKPFDRAVHQNVAQAVADAAIKSGVNRI